MIFKCVFHYNAQINNIKYLPHGQWVLSEWLEQDSNSWNEVFKGSKRDVQWLMV